MDQAMYNQRRNVALYNEGEQTFIRLIAGTKQDYLDMKT